MQKFKRVKHSNNFVLQGNGFYISYNPNTRLSTPFKFGDDGEETALCIEKKTGITFLILRGDWRKQYRKAFPSLKACRKVYEDNEAEHASVWSKR